MNFKNINEKLCHYCGLCAGICPTNCLSLGKESINFDESECINCGLCYKSCPGIEFDFPKARSHFKLGPDFDDLIGQYNSFFVGQTKDSEILKDSSSGGLSASISAYALENKIVDGVILVVKNQNSPLGYRIVIATTREEILERTQSLYHLLPLNVILKSVRKTNLSKLAYIGLPCHVEGIRKLQMQGNKDANKIKLIIGLFCGLNKQYEALDFFLSKLKVKKEDISEFSFRKGDWPGNLYIKTKDGKEYSINKDFYGFSYYMFAKERCLVCYDFMNEFADISLGDGWSKLPSKTGWNDIIIRSDMGKKIIDDMHKKDIITLEERRLKDIINSHRGYVHFKKRGLLYRMNRLNVSPYYGELKEYDFKSKLTYYFVSFLRLDAVKKLFYILPISLTGGLVILARKILRLLLFKRK